MQKESRSRTSWSKEEVRKLFDVSFNDLIARAHAVHRENFDPNEIQLSTLLNIKTGGCPENCAYCPQSAHFETGLKKEPLMSCEDVVAAAQHAKEKGSTRFCLGAAWRAPKGKDFERVLEMIQEVKKLGMESCVTLGLLTAEQAQRLKEAGLDFYNHNIDTSPEFYSDIITTRTFEDRMDTLGHVQNAGIHVCCGGILGMGESVDDRASMLWTLTTLPVPPKSIPLNKLIRIPGTPLEARPVVDMIDFVKTIAVARILFPTSYVRLSAGREDMSEETQALCFFAGVNSIHTGEILLTTPNPGLERDLKMLDKLGMKPLVFEEGQSACFPTDGDVHALNQIAS